MRCARGRGWVDQWGGGGCRREGKGGGGSCLQKGGKLQVIYIETEVSKQFKRKD